MLAELVDKLVAIGRQSEAFETLMLPGGKLLVRKPDGTTDTVSADDVFPRDKILDFDSLLAWCSQFAASDLTIMVGEGSIRVAAFRGATHLERFADLKFKTTVALDAISEWASGALESREVVQQLRSSLKGTCSAEYLPIFRRVDFSRQSDGTKSIAHDGESMGRAIESKAQSKDGKIPEELLFECELYSNVPNKKQALRYALTVDSDAELFRINEVGDCVEAAMLDVRAALLKRLRDELPDAVCFAGE